MADIVTIAPLVHAPGLIAYECPNCGYVTSVILPPADERKRLTSRDSILGLDLSAPRRLGGVDVSRHQSVIPPMSGLLSSRTMRALDCYKLG